MCVSVDLYVFVRVHVAALRSHIAPLNTSTLHSISGEDPFLGYTMVQPLVKGIQSQNVIANAKHFIMNNQETNRGGMTSAVDERTRFEMYYPPFEGASNAGVGSIMWCVSYNRVSTR